MWRNRKPTSEVSTSFARKCSKAALAFAALHLPNSAVRDYFYFFTPTPPGKAQPTLYDVLAHAANSDARRLAALV